MQTGRSLWLALSLSLGIHLLVALSLVGLSSEDAPARDSTNALVACVLVDEIDGAATATRAQRSSEGDQAKEDPAAEADGSFSSVVYDLAARVSSEESSPGGEGSTGADMSGPGKNVPSTNAIGGSEQGINYYGAQSRGTRIVYVIDRSLSMGLNGAFRQACDEMLNSLERLPADARFQVIVYNRHAEPLRVNGSSDLLPAERAVRDQVKMVVTRLRSEGSTDHLQAIKEAIRLHPDTIFLATDADDLTQETVDAVTRLNQGKTNIHAIEVTRWLEDRRSSLLKRLAEANGGTYRAIVVKP
jgi:hypothetical protein